MKLILISKVYVLQTSEGGRQSPIFSGYRANLFFENESSRYDSILEFKEYAFLEGGKEYEVELKVLHPELVLNVVRKGLPFSIMEGPKVIARCQILQIIN